MVRMIVFSAIRLSAARLTLWWVITSIPMMAPGDVVFVSYQTTIGGSAINTYATVEGQPRLVNGNDIPTYEDGPVTDSDNAGVEPVTPVNPSVTIDKTVWLGPKAPCSDGSELEEGPEGYTVTYW